MYLWHRNRKQFSLGIFGCMSSSTFMYFMVNTAFVNYLDQIDNLTATVEIPILKNRATLKQTLPISLNASKFDSDFVTAPKTLKDFIHQYKCKKKIFHLKERHDNPDANLPNKNLFTNNFIVDVFLFVTTIVSVLVTTLTIYLLCKHKKLKTLVTSLALQQIKEIGAKLARKMSLQHVLAKFNFI